MMCELPSLPAETNVVTLFSGGIDSTVALWKCLDAGLHPVVLEFEYEQRPAGECEAATRILDRCNGIERHTISLPVVNGNRGEILLSESNLIYYGIGANFAAEVGVDYLVGGQIKTDWDECGLEDATPSYYRTLAEQITKSHDTPPELVMPLLHKDKREVVATGERVGAPLELTWSCERAGDTSCGECFQCRKRATIAEECEADLL